MKLSLLELIHKHRCKIKLFGIVAAFLVALILAYANKDRREEAGKKKIMKQLYKLKIDKNSFQRLKKKND